LEGKNIEEPTEVSNEEEDKAYLLYKEYSGLYDDDVWEFLSVISTYLTPNIRMRIC
jgi:hypothetical protein